MPFFNEIFTKKELEELLENEVFQKMIGSKENPLNRPELLESENWFCIHGKFISKNMTIIGRAWVAASLNNRQENFSKSRQDIRGMFLLYNPLIIYYGMSIR